MARSHIVLIAMIFMVVLAIGSVSAADKSADAASSPVGQAVAAPGTEEGSSSDDASIGEDASAAEDGAMGPAIATTFGEGPSSAIAPGPAHNGASGLKVSAAVAATAAASAFFFF